MRIPKPTSELRSQGRILGFPILQTSFLHSSDSAFLSRIQILRNLDIDHRIKIALVSAARKTEAFQPNLDAGLHARGDFDLLLAGGSIHRLRCSEERFRNL